MQENSSAFLCCVASVTDRMPERDVLLIWPVRTTGVRLLTTTGDMEVAQTLLGQVAHDCSTPYLAANQENIRRATLPAL